MTIAELAEAHGITLHPWQAEAAHAIENGQHYNVPAARRSGKATFYRLARKWESSNGAD